MFSRLVVYSFIFSLAHSLTHSLTIGEDWSILVTTYTPFFDVPINEEITRGYQVTESTEPVTRQHIKSGRLKIKENLRNQYSQNWLETKSSSSTTSRENFTLKEVKKSYQFENYLKTVTNPAHRITLVRMSRITNANWKIWK